MRIPGLKTTRQVMRQFRSRLLGGAIILGYHRISAEGKDPFSMSVSPKNFAEQLAVIRDLATPISLPSLVQGLRNGELPRRTVALTLDDGYADNLYAAQPLLARYEMPATIFVVSGYLGQEFWWDELARLVFTEGLLAHTTCLTIAGREIEWQMPAGRNIYEQQRQLLQTLYRAIRSLTEQERQNSMEQLRRWVGDNKTEKPGHRALTSAELRTLADCPLIEIGSHTHTHPLLTTLTGAEQQAEIQRSKVELEEYTEQPITGFSYPNGLLTSETKALLCKAGFMYACTSNNDITRQRSNPFFLPRFWIPNWDGSQFSRWLTTWF